MVIHIQKTRENVLIVSVFFLAIFFGEFISKVLYTFFGMCKDYFSKNIPLYFTGFQQLSTGL